ncbi:tryptophan--tRNA ligase [Candidatus Kaiserbacteria bacterium RIFCSPHIGHO2_02_FULL_50_9]|uniref:Tryptophan--tRNA ligase n=1 Tax=Candidatus Kaiserbacteria bacterium RIFCSPLOWO2_01_FULL_51_21 TaxID=1798508 RepID=A0A1F6EDQ0_9BACT|nr:MAG: tryptophan--tRNA ligase [Candidatus Kaiserbacteria bacterium RIFCSPHIGHO2_01_FULL_51_33]OGG63512.1 MAG: tryptophan--tRNA ligase [Candidatus Kaiserbacteria bacterium RIFCSPHIGHO2_02_FULL_50_9]OGG71795.1 MAG: tryptophan--tRNA ligase [Candidatus Kaiserbacteria bacterium RIFCSPLOWO2_01_FULL_51_21]
MPEGKKILLSGTQPSGRLHIGNYLGALRQFVELQKTHESFFMIADYHALTSVQDGGKLAENTLNLAMDYLAIGIDPEESVIFKQSDVPEHMELAWIFNCITTMPYLMRAHAFKDAEAKNKEISVGKFEYPMLMAADILLYETEVVPIGQDQKQHVEITRDTAEKFNRIFGETFVLPAPLILDEVATVPGIDGRKMSKSYGNDIGLFADDGEIESKVMSIVTDSKGVGETKDPETCTVFALHKFFSQNELPDIERRYRDGSMSYKESKEILAKNLKDFIAPLREKRKTFERDHDRVIEILKKGGAFARERAQKKMADVRLKVGTTLY